MSLRKLERWRSLLNEDASAETGRIAVSSGDAVEVVLTPREACTSCGLCGRASDNSMRLIVKNPGTLQVGQFVEITLPRDSALRGMFFCLVLPLALFFAGGFAGHAAGKAIGLGGASLVLAAAGFAFAGLIAGYLCARRADRRFARKVFEETLVVPAGEGSKP